MPPARPPGVPRRSPRPGACRAARRPRRAGAVPRRTHRRRVPRPAGRSRPTAPPRRRHPRLPRSVGPPSPACARRHSPPAGCRPPLAAPPWPPPPAARTAPRWLAAARAASASTRGDQRLDRPLDRDAPCPLLRPALAWSTGRRQLQVTRRARRRALTGRHTPSLAAAHRVGLSHLLCGVRQPQPGCVSPTGVRHRTQMVIRAGHAVSSSPGGPGRGTRPAERPGTGDHRSRIHSDPRPGASAADDPVPRVSAACGSTADARTLRSSDPPRGPGARERLCARVAGVRPP